jgi:hypothetical protein
MQPQLNERDATTLWRKLINGDGISDKSLSEAKSLLERISYESPLRARFAAELEELKKLHQKKQSKSK